MTARQSRPISDGALRIDIDEECLHPAPRERGGEVYCSCGFANSSLLAYDSEHRSHLFENPRVLIGLEPLIGRRGRRRARALEIIERFLRVLHPPLRFLAVRRVHQARLEMVRRLRGLSTPEQQESETVVRARKIRL